jgi:methionyl-tRNA synthetase
MDLVLTKSGNFINRIVKFVDSKTYNGVVPDFKTSSDPLFEEHRKATNAKLHEYVTDFDAVKLRAALTHAMAISALGNKLLQDSRLDNKLAESDPTKCAQVVGLALNHVHLLASLISPYMPSTSESILQQLNASPLQIPDQYTFDTIKPG